MTAHTPGPWKVANGTLYAQWAVPGQWHGPPSSEANLRLQAAAPCGNRGCACKGGVSQ